MIVFVIKLFFFSLANSYSLGQKFYISHFFLFFYREMIRVLYTMLAIIIENLKLRLVNSNLPLRKSIILFEILAQKEEIAK